MGFYRHTKWIETNFKSTISYTTTNSVIPLNLFRWVELLPLRNENSHRDFIVAYFRSQLLFRRSCSRKRTRNTYVYVPQLVSNGNCPRSMHAIVSRLHAYDCVSVARREFEMQNGNARRDATVRHRVGFPAVVATIWPLVDPLWIVRYFSAIALGTLRFSPAILSFHDFDKGSSFRLRSFAERTAENDFDLIAVFRDHSLHSGNWY